MKKFILPLLILSLGLSGCKGNTSSSGDPSQGGSVETTAPSTGGETSVPPTVNNWPTSKIDAYLAKHGVTLNVPGLVVTTAVDFQLVDDDPNFGEYIEMSFESSDRADEYADLLEEANFDVEWDDDYEEYYAWDANEIVELEFFFIPEDDDYNDTMVIFIEVLDQSGNGGSTSELDNLEWGEVSSWPSVQIATYLEVFGADGEIPVLSSSTNIYIEFIDDDLFFEEPYLAMFILEGNREIAIKNTLESAGFLVELYEEDDFYAYFAYVFGDDFTIEVQFSYFSGDSDFEAGMEIYITVYLGDGSGNGGSISSELPEPTNKDNFSFFTFATEDQINGGTNPELTTWMTIDGAKFVVERNGAQVEVGNGSYFSSNEGLVHLYAGQKIAITAKTGSKIEQIVFEVKVSWKEGKNSIETLIDSAPINADIAYVDDVLVYSFNTSVSSVSFVLEDQIRVRSITLYYV